MSGYNFKKKIVYSFAEDIFLPLTNSVGAICNFQQCGILTSADSDSPVQPPFKLITPNDVQSVA